MYCPKCASQNFDDARFCRSCGADISLVPQALTGELTRQQPAIVALDPSRVFEKPRDGEKNAPSYEKAIQSIFLGVAFLIVFLSGFLLLRHAWVMWVWFIIPALACAGDGIGKLMRLRGEQTQQQRLPPPVAGASAAGAPVARGGGREVPAHHTSEIVAPQPLSSVTEGTTRHLDARDGQVK